MISLCILTRNNIVNNAEYFRQWMGKWKIDYELCVGDNSSIKFVKEANKILADEYIEITDKELFRGGIPQAHNRIAIECANSYNIFYIDSDEYPVFVNPHIEEMYEDYITLTCLRGDFATGTEIGRAFDILYEDPSMDNIKKILDGKEVSQQERLYNCRYAKFEGLCHSIFWNPQGSKSGDVAAVLLHSKPIRDKHPRENYTNPVIYEQYARQNVNPFLASSPVVLGWGREKTHQYKDYKEYIKKCRK